MLILLTALPAMAAPTLTCIDSTLNICPNPLWPEEAWSFHAADADEEWHIIAEVTDPGDVAASCPLGSGAQIRVTTSGDVELRALTTATTTCSIMDDSGSMDWDREILVVE
ncbi:MAG: hypothetical protein GY788_21150 [bacterium]|nr:hypothetical protein [bacterium]